MAFIRIIMILITKLIRCLMNCSTFSQTIRGLHSGALFNGGTKKQKISQVNASKLKQTDEVTK